MFNVGGTVRSHHQTNAAGARSSHRPIGGAPEPAVPGVDSLRSLHSSCRLSCTDLQLKHPGGHVTVALPHQASPTCENRGTAPTLMGPKAAPFVRAVKSWFLVLHSSQFQGSIGVRFAVVDCGTSLIACLVNDGFSPCVGQVFARRDAGHQPRAHEPAQPATPRRD
jgi:hypothetical protein